jgi:hypothetical protein
MFDGPRGDVNISGADALRAPPDAVSARIGRIA